MAPNETAEKMAHLRRTYDPKSLEHDTPSRHPADAEDCKQALHTQQADPRGRRIDHDIKAKSPEDTGDYLSTLVDAP